MKLATWMGITVQPPPSNTYRRLQEWWTNTIALGTADKQTTEQRIIYAAWNIWKERCRRIYDNKAMSVNQLICTIKSDTDIYQVAWRQMLSAVSS
jgi:hypothetical protein